MYREQPWLRHGVTSRPHPRLLLAAAARAATTDARRAQEASAKARKAAQAAKAKAEATEEEAIDAEDAAEVDPNDSPLAAAAAAARAAAEREAAAAARAEDTARRYEQRAVCTQQAALSFWDGEKDSTVGDPSHHQVALLTDRGLRPQPPGLGFGGSALGCLDTAASAQGQRGCINTCTLGKHLSLRGSVWCCSFSTVSFPAVGRPHSAVRGVSGGCANWGPWSLGVEVSLLASLPWDVSLLYVSLLDMFLICVSFGCLSVGCLSLSLRFYLRGL